MSPLETAVLSGVGSTTSDGATGAQVGRLLLRLGYGPLSIPLGYRTLYRLGRMGHIVRIRKTWKITQAGQKALREAVES